MIVAIPVGANHVPQAISLLNWLAELDGGSRHPCLLVIAREISYDALQELLVAAGKAFCNVSSIKAVFMDRRREPDTENLLFRAVCDYNSKVTKQPFFWLALDAVPTSAGWLDRIEMENRVKAPVRDTPPKDYPLRSAAFPDTVFARGAQAIEQLRGDKSGSPYQVLRPEWPKVQKLSKRPKREPSITLIYIHVPGEEQHWKYAREFVDTYNKFQPQYSHKTVVVCQGKPATPLVRGLFKMLPNLRYFEHDDSGWDIGAFIAASRDINDDCVVCLGGSAHFRREGWLRRIADSWQKHGAGFYGATPTHEVSPHLCTSGFWCPPEVLSSYPIKVVNRVTRYDFEHGPNACWKMVAHNGLPVKLVTWDGEFDWQDWRKPPNIYRRGDQSNALIYWHHFREYEKASPQQKVALSTRSDTLTDPHYLALLNSPVPEVQSPEHPSLVSRMTNAVKSLASDIVAFPSLSHRKSPQSIAIAYLYPCDARETFMQFATRWIESYKRFAPKLAHDVIVYMSNGTPNDADYAIFKGVPVQFSSGYEGGGWDIGHFQHIAKVCDHDLVVFMNSRSYLWREGWLEPFIDAAKRYGMDGLYGSMASYEACAIPNTFPAPNPHIRTSCFVTNPKVLRLFPHLVDSREQSFKFESGEWNVSDWYANQGFPVKLVTADGFYDRNDWRKPANIFRRGNQSNCLIADRHTLIYATASEAERRELSARADGGWPRRPIPPIKHIGIKHAIAHKTITVVAATSLNPTGHAKAIEWTASLIPYPCEKLLICSQPAPGFTGTQLPLPEPWAKDGKWSVDDMSDFLLSGLHKYINTDVAIIVHDDGYALNKSKWTNDFLNCDYIGAPWPTRFPWTKPGNQVGNGGFSLRSKRWLEHASKLGKLAPGTSEDVYCGVTNATHFLRAGYNIAPLGLAMRWSFEHTIEEFPSWKLSDSFGFHGLTSTVKERKHLRL